VKEKLAIDHLMQER